MEHACDLMMERLGFAVVRLSQARRSNIHVGLPDRRYYCVPRRLACWFECKRVGGKQSEAQREFQLMVMACNEDYVVGQESALLAWLRDHKVIV